MAEPYVIAPQAYAIAMNAVDERIPSINSTIDSKINQLIIDLNGGINPTTVSPNTNLGAPSDSVVYYVGAGSYTVPAGTIQGQPSQTTITVTGNLAMLFWDNQYWAKLDIPISVDLAAYALKADIVNNFTTGGATKMLSAEAGKLIASALPLQTAGKELILPSVQNGYFRFDNGTLTSSSGFLSYKFPITDISIPLYVSGAIRDQGTALMFYYNASNALIGTQFRGTSTKVTYTKQIVDIPSGTAFIGITVVSNDVPAKIYTDTFATDIARKADIVNNLSVGGIDKMLSAEQGKIIGGTLPKVKTPQVLPNAQQGFYSSSNGNFTSNAAYISYSLNVADYTLPIYVTGRVKDAGTALAFYYNSSNQFISYQFQGTSTEVNYDKQLLTLPVGTTRIGITVLATGGPAQIFTDSLANDILTKSVADITYLSKTTADVSYITSVISPTLPVAGEVIYDTIDFATTNTTNGDTQNNRYTNLTSRILKGGTTLKKVRAKVSDATTLKVFCVSVVSTGGVLSVTNLHQFPDISATSDVSEYNVTDTFILPVGSYMAIGDTLNRIYFVANIGNSYRMPSTFASVATSKVGIAFNFTTSDSIADTTSVLLNERTGDDRYALKILSIPGVPINNKKQVKIKLAPTDKILLYGDSISSTDYTWYKSEMETLTGATVYNGGFSGFTTANLAKNAQLQRIFDYGANLVVVLVGGNDNGASGTVGTFGAVSSEPVVSETDLNVDYNGTYFIQAVSHIVRKFKAQYYNIRQRANLNGTETEAEKTAKIDAVLKPYLVFATTLPQKRTNSSSAFSNPLNWQRKRDAIVECCNRYNVHCVDLFNFVGWDMTLEPFLVGATDKNTNNGIYTMDGLHPNKYGYSDIAKIVCGEIGII